MPATYDKLGIRFLYPDNWILNEDDALEAERTVSVHSPGGGFWSISRHEPAVEPTDLADTALAVMQAEYPDGEVFPGQDTIAGQAAVGYDLNFFYLDFTNTAIMRSFRIGDASYLVIYQAEDREFAENQPVFRAITISLVIDES